MRRQGWSFENYIERTTGKRVVAMCASAFLQIIADNYKELQLERHIEYIVDNDKNKVGQYFSIHGINKPIRSLEYLLKEKLDEIVILIGTDRFAYDIYTQLSEIADLNDVDCFVLPLMIANRKDDEEFCIKKSSSDSTIIPKIIHCFWLGNDPLNGMAQNCLDSFKRYCPDYEIKLWTYKNYDVSKNQFMYDAYKAKNWAYACDYARLDKLYEEGGVYFDLDVELFANIDCLLQNEFFAGFGPIRDIELAAFGSTKNNALVGEILSAYNDKIFDVNRKMGITDVQPLLVDRILEKKGFSINGKYQSKNGHTLYPREVFSARNWFTGEIVKDDNSLGVHRCAGSWVDSDEKNISNQRGLLLKKLETIFSE